MIYEAIDETISLNVGESKSWTLTAPAPADWLTGWCQWSRPGKFDVRKDVRVTVKMPQGFSVVFDEPTVSGAQTFFVSGPAGEYVLTLANDGERNLTGVRVMAALGRS